LWLLVNAGFPGSVIREAKRKAAVLENFETVMEALQQQGDSGTQLQPSQAAPSQQHAAAGRDTKRLRQLADMFKQLPLSTLSSNEQLPAVKQLVSKLYVGNCNGSTATA
jgi:hypothetical protein